MTYIKLPKQPIDDKMSTRWGIAFLSSVTGGVKKKGGGIVIFDLVNMDTQRAHRMSWTGVGKKGGPPVGGAVRNTDYTYFTTARPANFPDFDKARVKLEMKDRLIHSKISLTIYDGFNILAEMKISGWGPSVPGSLNGQGITEIYYSDGRPVETPEFTPNIQSQPEDTNIRAKVTDNGDSFVIRLPGDVLFDFDRDWLHYEASATLDRVIKYLNAKPGYTRMVIEGHTDSKEKVPGYNMDLSRRRAKTVHDYFVKYASALDATYKLSYKGFGATQPVAPNKHPNGSDNPEGREKNRRVEIYVYKK
jgi:outer membrane protein OmpA-like peptidoglycan-associated protein